LAHVKNKVICQMFCCHFLTIGQSYMKSGE
jgi:hypothetical protein